MGLTMKNIDFLNLPAAEQYSLFYEASHSNCYAAYIRGKRCVDEFGKVLAGKLAVKAARFVAEKLPQIAEGIRSLYYK